jgi:hypothetical protein
MYEKFREANALSEISRRLKVEDQAQRHAQQVSDHLQRDVFSNLVLYDNGS